MSRHSVILLLLLLVLMSACRPRVPGKYIQPSEMEDMLYDYYMAQGMATVTTGEGDSIEYRRELYLNAMLKKYGISRADFDTSLIYYYTHADRFLKIYKRVGERLSNDAVSLGASASVVDVFSTSDESGDTTNIWADRKWFSLVPYPPYNKFTFTYTADSTYKQGDSFVLNIVSDFLYQSGTKDAVAYLRVRYDNDSVASRTTHIFVSGLTQMRIPETRYGIKEVSGFLLLGQGNQRDNTMKLMLINNIQLVRIHKRELPQQDMAPAPGGVTLRQNISPAPSHEPLSKRDSIRTTTNKPLPNRNI